MVTAHRVQREQSLPHFLLDGRSVRLSMTLEEGEVGRSKRSDRIRPGSCVLLGYRDSGLLSIAVKHA